MTTPVRIYKPLLERSFRIGGLRTRRSTVEQALTEFIARREQLRITEIFGTVDFDPDYNYKTQRRRG